MMSPSLVLLFLLAACTTETDAVETADTAAPGDTWESFGRDFMATYCVECHDESPKDFTQLADVTAFAETIRCGTAAQTAPGCDGWPPAGQFPVGSGAMPSDEERDRLVAWIDAGLSESR